jgi:hypothetical protein
MRQRPSTVATTLTSPVRYFVRRTRPTPGPLGLTALVWLAVAGTVVHAHDPGLSSLDVSVEGARVSVVLAMSASDVALVANGDERRLQLSQLAREAIRLSIDGRTMTAGSVEVTLDDGGARVHLAFDVSPAEQQTRRLQIESDVPDRVSRGHREMLVVKTGDRLLTEQLLDNRSGPVTIDVATTPPAVLHIARQYVELGVGHILAGYDHLVFLAGLLLASRRARELILALTAFTIGHSVSLALVVLAGVHAPSSIVEPLIAASIAWVGIESLIYGRCGTRWPLVFGFGIIHGFGFAGALIELGLGTSAAQIVLTLLSFNIGVEAGQIATVTVMLPLVWLLRSRPHWHARLLPVCSAMIAVAGGYWLIDRLR